MTEKDYADIRDEIIEIMTGGSVLDYDKQDEALERAEQILDLVISWQYHE